MCLFSFQTTGSITPLTKYIFELAYLLSWFPQVQISFGEIENYLKKAAVYQIGGLMASLLFLVVASTLLVARHVQTKTNEDSKKEKELQEHLLEVERKKQGRDILL